MAIPNGLKAVDVRTDDVSDDSADVIRGDGPPGESKLNPEKRFGGPGLRPGFGPTVARGVKSNAPCEFDSLGVGLPARVWCGGVGSLGGGDGEASWLRGDDGDCRPFISVSGGDRVTVKSSAERFEAMLVMARTWFSNVWP